MASSRFRDRCSNPFETPGHLSRIGLRKPTPTMISKMSNLSAQHLICTSCRLRLYKMDYKDPQPEVESVSDDDDTISPEIISQASQMSIGTALPVVNEALLLLDQSIPRKKIRSEQWIQAKVDSASAALRTTLGASICNAAEKDSEDFNQMIDELKKEYHAADTTEEMRYQILTLLPKSWSVNKVVQKMDTTRYMAGVAKRLVESKGILSPRDARRGTPLSEETKAKVREFYEADTMSSMMPGKKDFISIKMSDGTHIHKQKRLLLSNLREMYSCFEEKELPIGLASFAALRPKHCVFANGSGTHTVCVCSLHQNMNLMILGCNLARLTKDSAFRIQTYDDVLMALVCNDPQPTCYLGHCDHCPGGESLRKMLLELFDNSGVTTVTYKQWVSKTRTTLNSVENQSITQFIAAFQNQASTLLKHAFIVKEQARFFKKTEGRFRNWQTCRAS